MKLGKPGGEPSGFSDFELSAERRRPRAVRAERSQLPEAGTEAVSARRIDAREVGTALAGLIWRFSGQHLIIA